MSFPVEQPSGLRVNRYLLSVLVLAAVIHTLRRSEVGGLGQFQAIPSVPFLSPNLQLPSSNFRKERPGHLSSSCKHYSISDHCPVLSLARLTYWNSNSSARTESPSGIPDSPHQVSHLTNKIYQSPELCRSQHLALLSKPRALPKSPVLPRVPSPFTLLHTQAHLYLPWFLSMGYHYCLVTGRIPTHIIASPGCGSCFNSRAN